MLMYITMPASGKVSMVTENIHAMRQIEFFWKKKKFQFNKYLARF